MSIETRSNQYGTVFEHWQIKELLGQGSGGKTAVFLLNRNDSFQESCALKVVNLIEEKGRLSELPEFRKLEYQEVLEDCKAQATTEVRLMLDLRGNTNVVDYLDHKFVSWSDASGFGCDLLIRMELLTDLRSILRNGKRFTEAEILRVGRDICTALVLCHDNDILHRDIKPENIMVNRKGNYKLGDFGVSRLLGSSPSSMASTGIGTPEYAAPEQFSGRHDKRVDIYSLGLVLYELSNQNRLPFATSSYVRQVDVQKRQSGAAFPRPQGIGDGLWDLIQKACAYDPEDRFDTAQQMLAALYQLQAGAIPRSSFSGGNSAPGQSYSTQPAEVCGQYATAAASQGGYATTPASQSRDSYATAPASPAGRDSYATAPATQAERREYRTAPAPSSGASYQLAKKQVNWKVLALIAAVIALFALIFQPGREKSSDAPETTEAPIQTEGLPAATEHIHSWMDATYQAPKTCTTCGLTEGTPLVPDPIYINEMPRGATYGKLWTRSNTVPNEVTNSNAADMSTRGHLTQRVYDHLGNEYTYGLHMDLDAPSSTYYVTFDLGGIYTSFTGVCSLAYEVRNTRYSKYFEVYCDNVLAFTSNTMTANSAPQPFVIDVTGVQTLRIQYPPTDGENSIAMVYDGLLSCTNPTMLSVGDVISLGKYEQDGNFTNNAEDIAWMVLETQENQAFLIAQDCIEVMQYHTSRDSTTWENCGLRYWLNSTFYRDAFTDEERSAVLLSFVDNAYVPDYGTYGGNDTQDYIFLLSVPEVQYYFSRDSVSRESRATPYALNRGAGSLGTSEYWWTRTPGNYQNTARVIDAVDTRICPEGDNVACTDNVVRPAMWIDLTKLPA